MVEAETAICSRSLFRNYIMAFRRLPGSHVSWRSPDKRAAWSGKAGRRSMCIECLLREGSSVWKGVSERGGKRRWNGSEAGRREGHGKFL